jgi:hypothetical protein
VLAGDLQTLAPKGVMHRPNSLMAANVPLPGLGVNADSVMHRATMCIGVGQGIAVMLETA